MARFPSLSTSWSTAIVSGLALLSTIIPTVLATSGDTIQGTNGKGVTQTLLVDRYPALYSGNFGDCMGGQSLLNLTSYDAAYYADNMTVLFNLAGTTSLRNESLMLYISVHAYGGNQFNLVFNPCNANFASLCPLNASVPITGGAVIPVSTSDVAAIPEIALSIPDFEASVQLRFFANSSETQIACFSAVMRNGATFSHPAAVGSVLGIFTVVALLASFATVIYGVSIPHMRTHYAHSLSVLVVFEVFQSIFFSGALSLNWPSVCTAFWSNFAWSAGMIYTHPIISSINSFAGVSGNGSQVGGAGSTILNTNGGLQQQIYGRSLKSESIASEKIASQIYQRAMDSSPYELARRSAIIADSLVKRATNGTSNTPEKLFAWGGTPVAPGLPIPGNWSNFEGELSMVDIPAADAFMVGFLWFLILLAILIGSTVIFKYSLEGFATIKWIKHDRFAMFRSHWLKFIGLIVLRSCFIAFFTMMTLALYQFSAGGKAGPIAIAVIVFIIFFAGAIGVSVYACFYRVKFGRYESKPDRIHFQQKKVLKFIPWYKTARESSMDEEDKTNSAASVSFFNVKFVDHDSEHQGVHQNEKFTKRFGWLSARYRRTRWWFFSFWVVYQFVRACFVGGARANPTAQVFGIFIWEVIAFIAMISINPYESNRNTALAVYMLGISKVVTSGLSISFLPQYNLARIPTTVIGVIIIVVQGFLVVALLILIVLGAISTYMSLTRNHEEFKPHTLENIRMKYFAHLEVKEKDVPPPPPPVPEEPKEPYFTVNNVRRAPKIEDEDVDDVPDLADFNPSASQPSFATPGAASAGRSRADSMGNSIAGASMRSQYSAYGNVPFGARVHRASWSSRDFMQYQEQNRGDSPFGTPSRTASGMSQHISNNSIASRAPLVRPQVSHTSLRPSTPTREQQQKFANQRVAHAS